MLLTIEDVDSKLRNNMDFLIECSNILILLTNYRRRENLHGFGLNRFDEELIVDILGYLEENKEITQSQEEILVKRVCKYKTQLYTYFVDNTYIYEKFFEKDEM